MGGVTGARVLAAGETPAADRRDARPTRNDGRHFRAHPLMGTHLDTACVGGSSGGSRFGSFPAPDRVNAELQTTGRRGSGAVPGCAHLIVSGTTSSNATSVTVNGSSATLYGDYTFSKDGFTITNGNNAWMAIVGLFVKPIDPPVDPNGFRIPVRPPTAPGGAQPYNPRMGSPGGGAPDTHVPLPPGYTPPGG